MAWQKVKDEVGYQHFFPVNGEYQMKVEKSRGGDYFITVVTSEGDCLDSGVIYAGTLIVAKQKVEDIVRRERYYHIVAINEKTGAITYMTSYPMSHSECCTMISKISKYTARRIQVVEVSYI